MAGRYIPPHFRNATKVEEPKVENTPTKFRSQNYNQDEINNYFWLKEDAESEKAGQYFDGKGKTLHGSRARPKQLVYVMLYYDANPRWESDGIIFTKSSLELLPGYATDASSTETTSATTVVEAGTAATSQNIAVFKQMYGRTKTSGFKFEGWFKSDNVAFLSLIARN